MTISKNLQIYLNIKGISELQHNIEMNMTNELGYEGQPRLRINDRDEELKYHLGNMGLKTGKNNWEEVNEYSPRSLYEKERELDNIRLTCTSA